MGIKDALAEAQEVWGNFDQLIRGDVFDGAFEGKFERRSELLGVLLGFELSLC